ncbi:MAG: hypothetical protein HC820_01630 [Hydrococcus sp. RM1_1_31]|nr:hypothetical protein [Hydrococcus sp. RM1_1_31]
MIRHILLASTIVLSSTLALTSTTSAQTTDPYVNELLRQTNGIIQDTNRYIDEVVIPEGQQYQAYLQQLLNNCIHSGNMAACNEYNIRMKRQLIHMDNIKRQMEQNRQNQ